MAMFKQFIVFSLFYLLGFSFLLYLFYPVFFVDFDIFKRSLGIVISFGLVFFCVLYAFYLTFFTDDC